MASTPEELEAWLGPIKGFYVKVHAKYFIRDADEPHREPKEPQLVIKVKEVFCQQLNSNILQCLSTNELNIVKDNLAKIITLEEEMKSLYKDMWSPRLGAIQSIGRSLRQKSSPPIISIFTGVA